MGQNNINVSIDDKGNLVCPDVSGILGESFTWVPDINSVASIQSITASVGAFNPLPSAANGWTGTMASEGIFRNGGQGLEYTIVVNPRNSSIGQKQKSPKIMVTAHDLVSP